MKQENGLKFSNEDGSIETFCKNDKPLGEFHDYLMKLKAWCVDRMLQNQKQEEEITNQIMENSKDIESE